MNNSSDTPDQIDPLIQQEIDADLEAVMSRTPTSGPHVARLHALTDSLTNEVVYGWTYLRVWKGLGQYFAENSEVAGMTKTFLPLVRAAFADSAILHLAKVYDKHKDSLSVYKVIRLAEHHRKKVVDPAHLSERLIEWKTVNPQRDKQLEILFRYRDNFLAHPDKRILNETFKSTLKLPYDLADQLYGDANDLLNIVSSAFLGYESAEMVLMDHNDFKPLLDYAKQGKRARMRALDRRRQKSIPAE